MTYQPGETLATHPAGHHLVAYEDGGQIWSAVYHARGLVIQHGVNWGWKDFSGIPARTIILTKRELAELQDVAPSGDMPPLLPSQDGLVEHTNGHASTADSIFVDWPQFWTTERDDDMWLYEPILAKSRGHAIFAGHKVGKSLILLYISIQLATSPDPVVVIYLDYEMTRDDLEERLTDMGIDSNTDLSRLRYSLIPSLPALDTPQGAMALLDIVDQEQAQRPDHHIIVILDTTARAVAGEENSADTIRAFYRHTGSGLKRREVTWARLDHAGKDPTKGQRGSSAKGDDVDVVWRIAQADNGLKFTREAARINWIPETVEFARTDEPLAFATTTGLWPAGTEPKAKLLDRLGAPTDISFRQARKLLEEHKETARNDVLAAAIKWRKQRTEPTTLVPMGTAGNDGNTDGSGGGEQRSPL